MRKGPLWGATDIRPAVRGGRQWTRVAVSAWCSSRPAGSACPGSTIPVTGNAFVSLDDLQYVGNPLVMQGISLRGIAFAFTSVTALYSHPLAWLSHELDFEWEIRDGRTFNLIGGNWEIRDGRGVHTPKLRHGN